MIWIITNLKHAKKIWAEGFRKGLKPPPMLTVSEYADQFRVLPKSSVEPGRWSTLRTPYLKEPMDNLSIYSPVEQTKVMKGTQLGFTEAGNNWICYIVDIAPSPSMMVLPTDMSARDHAKQKLNPTFRAMPRLEPKLFAVRSRTAGSTMTYKEFLGGFLNIAGANTGVTFRHKSIRNFFADDIDGWPSDVDGEGDPLGLGENRTDAYGKRKKIYKVSSPTADIKSRIIKEMHDSDWRQFHVPCPACGMKQPLEWGGPDVDFGFKWDKGKNAQNLPETVKYQCKHCKELFAEYHKPQILAEGVWIPKNPGHKHRGYHLPSFYSPLGWLSWEQIVEEFLKATRDNDIQLIKRWVTTRKAEPFKDAVIDLEHNKLFEVRENYGETIPEQAQVVVASADIQDDRIEVLVDAYGRGLESWGIEHKVLNGSPAEQSVWDALDAILDKTYLHASGNRKKISLTCIDSGGHHTKRVYDYVRSREIRRIYATKGSSLKGKPLVSGPNTNNLGKIKLYMIGTDTAKELVYSALQIVDDDGNAEQVHFNMGFDEEWFKQLVSETVDSDGKWHLPPGKRNEALDLKVLSLAALDIINPDWDSFDTLDLTSQAYNAYTESKHLDDSIEIDPELPIVVCCDFNQNPLMWVLLQCDNKEVRVFDEISIRNCTTIRMGAEVMRKYGGHPKGFHIYGSAKGTVRSGMNRSDYALMKDLGFGNQYIDRINPSIFDRVNAVNNKLENLSGDVGIKIHPKCVNLKRDFERALWLDDNTDIDRTEAGLGNASDAFSYFISKRWPIRKATLSNTFRKRRFYK